LKAGCERRNGIQSRTPERRHRNLETKSAAASTPDESRALRQRFDRLAAPAEVSPLVERKLKAGCEGRQPRRPRTPGRRHRQPWEAKRRRHPARLYHIGAAAWARLGRSPQRSRRLAMSHFYNVARFRGSMEPAALVSFQRRRLNAFLAWLGDLFSANEQPLCTQGTGRHGDRRSLAALLGSGE
jgi:hypothetical protein